MRDHDHNCSAALAVTTGTLFYTQAQETEAKAR